MRLARWRTARRDEGSTQIILLAAMVCALGLTLLAVQVAQANDLRTRAQTAADAAAIAALTPLRDAAISLAQGGIDPAGIGLWSVAPNVGVDDPVYNRAARTYANRNRADLAGKVHVTGPLGHTMKVDVRSQDCSILSEKEAKDPQYKDAPTCTDQGRQVKGLKYPATAVAELRLPACDFTYSTAGETPDSSEQIPVALRCGGQLVWQVGGWSAGRESMIRLFKIRLVAEEDATPYTGMPSYADPGGPIIDPADLPPGTPEQVRRAIAFAMSKIGTWYLWGGTGPRYDCSGLMMRAWQYAGINIPRVADAQYRASQRVPDGQVQPGDLVFFQRPGEPVHHVGMVIDPAKHIMVEAPHTGAQVRTSSYLREDLIGFGRVYQG
ncbi:C40 family peptidase [Actinomadura scrupuli]|uniref:C40 family peptidase n=1 Tax=Actinomadura scrupuli TaxID=559629 RepID=UPI003D954C5D